VLANYSPVVWIAQAVLGLLCTCLFSCPAMGAEYVKTKVIESSPDNVFVIAENVARKLLNAEILECDKQSRILRFQLPVTRSSAPRGGTMLSERASPRYYAILIVQPDLAPSKSKVHLSVGIVEDNPFSASSVPPGFKPVLNRQSRFSKHFFRLLEEGLRP
jgi:hypothetical protein